MNLNYRVEQKSFPLLKRLSFSIVIPFKNNEEDHKRLVNLETCLAYYKKHFPKSEIIVAEQFESEPIFNMDGIVKADVKLKSAISRSKLLNAGWGKSTKEVILFCDNDYILQVDSILSSVSLIQNGIYDIIKPYRCIFNLPQEYDQANNSIEELDLNICSFEADWIALTGGSFIVSNKFYNNMGGFDESFIGWGGEDDASSIVAINLGKYISYDSHALHLYHKKINKFFTDVERRQYAKNQNQLGRVSRMDQVQFDEYVSSLRKNLEQYKK